MLLSIHVRTKNPHVKLTAPVKISKKPLESRTESLSKTCHHVPECVDQSLLYNIFLPSF